MRKRHYGQRVHTVSVPPPHLSEVYKEDEAASKLLDTLIPSSAKSLEEAKRRVVVVDATRKRIIYNYSKEYKDYLNKLDEQRKAVIKNIKNRLWKRLKDS